jgi:transcriptional accessory protein Tex/SPT6
MDDWWDVDERAGVIRGQRSGQKIGIGDVVKVAIASVDVPRRELDLAVLEIIKKSGHPDPGAKQKPPHKHKPKSEKHAPRGGATRRNQRSKRRHRRK